VNYLFCGASSSLILVCLSLLLSLLPMNCACDDQLPNEQNNSNKQSSTITEGFPISLSYNQQHQQSTTITQSSGNEEVERPSPSPAAPATMLTVG
jgi:hypothetical protein